MEFRNISAVLLLSLASDIAIADSWEGWEVVTTYSGALIVGVLTIGPFVVTTESSKATSDAFSKKVSMAQEDAASYIATSGEVRGAKLESALKELRRNPEFAMTDERQLVQAILAYSTH